MSSPPDWLTSFVTAVTAAIHSHDLLSPLGCHFKQVGDVWEITVFASRTEIVGGPQDGLVSHSRFNVDVMALRSLFSEVQSISWQAQPMGADDDLGSHLSIEGIVAPRQIWLRITAMAPERFGIGRRAFINQEHIEEIW